MSTHLPWVREWLSLLYLWSVGAPGSCHPILRLRSLLRLLETHSIRRVVACVIPYYLFVLCFHTELWNDRGFFLLLLVRIEALIERLLAECVLLYFLWVRIDLRCVVYSEGSLRWCHTRQSCLVSLVIVSFVHQTTLWLSDAIEYQFGSGGDLGAEVWIVRRIIHNCLMISFCAWDAVVAWMS